MTFRASSSSEAVTTTVNVTKESMVAKSNGIVLGELVPWPTGGLNVSGQLRIAPAVPVGLFSFPEGGSAVRPTGAASRAERVA